MGRDQGLFLDRGPFGTKGDTSTIAVGISKKKIFRNYIQTDSQNQSKLCFGGAVSDFMESDGLGSQPITFVAATLNVPQVREPIKAQSLVDKLNSAMTTSSVPNFSALHTLEEAAEGLSSSPSTPGTPIASPTAWECVTEALNVETHQLEVHEEDSADFGPVTSKMQNFTENEAKKKSSIRDADKDTSKVTKRASSHNLGPLIKPDEGAIVKKKKRRKPKSKVCGVSADVENSPPPHTILFPNDCAFLECAGVKCACNS